jgi:1-phosphofructokinase family hexose kinase/ketose-bisphosphate aldolase
MTTNLGGVRASAIPLPSTAGRPAVRVAAITLNPAIDVTYRIPALLVDDVVRVRQVSARAGGKGVNVAAVAGSLGAQTWALVLTGGRSGAELIEGMADLGLQTLAVDALADVRRTVAVVADDGTTTSLQEPGHEVRDPERLSGMVLDAIEQLLVAGVRAVAVSGSLPPRCPLDLLPQVVDRCRRAGVPVVVDTSGAALASVVASGAVLTPNRAELADLTGRALGDEADVVAAAESLVAAGASAVLVTLGRDGIVGVTADAAWAARPPRAVEGNPTGAGDAAVAALLTHLAATGDAATVRWPEALADMVATSAACVLRPTAGEIDEAARAAWLPDVQVRMITQRGAPTMNTEMATITRDCRTAGTAVGAFNAILLEHAEAIVAGAEDAGLPVVVQLSQNAVEYHGGLAPLARAALALAKSATVPVTVHLDHAQDETLVYEALDLGIRSVMFDAAHESYAENVRRTADVVARCHAVGCWVEAELGEVGGKNGAHAPGARTDPVEALDFVTATGVDALAIAVGSSHAMASRDAVLDDALITQIRDAVGIPLVLHGSSGVPDDGLRSAVRHGITKVNVGTRLNVVLTEQVRHVLAESPHLTDPRRYLAPGRDAVRAEVRRLLCLLAGT